MWGIQLGQDKGNRALGQRKEKAQPLETQRLLVVARDQCPQSTQAPLTHHPNGARVGVEGTQLPPAAPKGFLGGKYPLHCSHRRAGRCI